MSNPSVEEKTIWSLLRDDIKENKAETIRNLAIPVGLFIGIILAGWRSYTSHVQSNTSIEQTKISQLGLNSERYQKGAEMLGNKKLSIRMSGIFALEELARNHSEDYYIQIMTLFREFICHPPLHTEKNQEYDHQVYPRDVEQALRSYGKCRADFFRKNELNIKEEFMLNLENANLEHMTAKYMNLRWVSLSHANLTRVTLEDSDLTEASLNGATLIRARLVNVDLTDAKLSGADLTDADLICAILVRANLDYANLTRANLVVAELREANLFNVRLIGAKLEDANLMGADLNTANLASANLRRTNLMGAFLPNANLAGADLTDANLTKANLTHANLAGANLTGANLINTILTGADLENANLKNTILEADSFIDDD